MSCVAFCWKAGRAAYVAFSEVQSLKSKIKSILEDKNIKEANVRVDKPGALRFADSVSIELTKKRK